MPPPVSHILETCLYVKSINESVGFYKKTLEIEPFLDTPRIAGFAVGNTTLLLFQLGLTASDSHPTPQSCIPGHGPTEDITVQLTSGPHSLLKQHYCLAVSSREEVEAWETHLKEHGVKLLGTMNWERGGRSVYFEDPDGHVGEVGSRGIWAHY